MDADDQSKEYYCNWIRSIILFCSSQNKNGDVKVRTDKTTKLKETNRYNFPI